MRKDHLAETLLSLVGPADRARSTIGDLMEEERQHGGVWFWRSVTRVWLAMLGRDLMKTPLAMALSCAVGWFLYMAVSLVFAFVAYIALTLAWGVSSALATHTGVELLTNALRLQFDWPPIPHAATYLMQAVVLLVIAPFQIGRGSARFWRGHEVSLAVMMLIVWTAMAALVPFVLVGISARPSMVPVMAMFVLGGAVFERFRTLATKHTVKNTEI